MKILKLTKGSANSRTDRQCEHDGGQCEFFLLCWMSSGLIQGTCSGVLRGCCHRTAKSSNVGNEATNQLFNLTNLPNKDFGPVVNENSECSSILYSILWKNNFSVFSNPSMFA